MPGNKRSAAIVLITAKLTDTQSALADSALYISYFLLAIPAGKFMKKYSFKSGIIFGLILFAGGAFYRCHINSFYEKILSCL